MESFETSITLPVSVQAAFDFLIQPVNIKRISPPDVGLFFVKAPERLSLSAQMEFKVQAFGLARDVVHEITTFDEPDSFTEQQVSGPLGSWSHHHLFENLDDRSVRITDRIEFEPPGGIVGLVITADRILENLEEGFEFRYEQLEKLLGPTD